MVSTGEQEVEYESDPEEVKRSLAMRRREASDDEEVEQAAENDDNRGVKQRAVIPSDESDGQGGVAEYDDEEELGVEEEDEEGYDEEEEDIEEEVVEGREYLQVNEKRSEADGLEGPKMKKTEGGGRRNIEEAVEGHAADHVVEEEEKENEPFAVPTAGAFYMHDDRFQDNVGGGHRRIRGGRKLWESKNDRKWGHDMFEEMNVHERQYGEVVPQSRRSSRGRYRGRGGNKGHEHGYARGSDCKAFSSNGNQNQTPKVVTRGRGPRRYETAMKHSKQASSLQNKQSRNSLQKTLRTDAGAAPTPTASTAFQTKKHLFSSTLSSASPPFYPSGATNNLTQKEDRQAGMEKLHMNESTSATGKNFNKTKMPSSGSSLVSTAPSSQSRGQGKIAPVSGQVIYQPAHNKQVNRISLPTQLYTVQKGTSQSRIQPSARAPSQQTGQHPVTRSLASSPPKTSSSRNSNTAGELDSPSEMGALVAKGKGSLQASGRGSLLYSGTQVMGSAGNLAVGHGDQNFPAFLPVMQFGSQHPGGMGLPAFGMAFPGYVAQSQHGLENSEMTWLPVLTGAGTLGATYCSPFAAVDGTYHSCSSGQPSSAGGSSKENSTNKLNSELKPSQRTELVSSDEFPQRQINPNKQPRRYSEMSFSK